VKVALWKNGDNYNATISNSYKAEDGREWLSPEDMEMVAIQPHALRHMGLGYIINPAKSLRRCSMLPSHFFTQKAMRKFQFRTLERQQIIGRPDKKLRLRYARQRRPNPFRWRKSPCRRIHE
jgi:hypothetical protein